MEKKRIDELFRKGMQTSDIPFDELHWTTMEEKLIKRQRKNRIIWMASLSAAAVLLFALLLPLWSSNSLDKHRGKLVENQGSKTNNIPKTQFPQVQRKSTEKKPEDQKIKRTTPEKQQQEKVEKEHELPRIEHKQPLVAQAAPPALLKMNRPEPSIRITHNPTTLHTQIDAGKLPGSRSTPKQRPYFSIAVAPDITAVQGSSDQSLSPNIGLLFTMPLYQKLSITTGLWYAKKNYKSSYDFYKPTVRLPWTAKPTDVRANCDVLDIPLELNYQVYQRNRTKINVSAGASSYLMLREQYHFSYAKPEDSQNSITDYEIKRQNNHLLGVANLSFTLEHQVSPSLALGIRPFVKLPLTGIGYGQTRLESKGIAIIIDIKRK